VAHENDNEDIETDVETTDAEDVEQPDEAIDTPDEPEDESAEDLAPAAKTYDENYVKKLRDENAKYRTRLRDDVKKARDEAAQEARDAFARDLLGGMGLLEDENEVDPTEAINLANSRAEEAAERLRNYEIKDALRSAAEKHGGDMSLLYPHLLGTDVLLDLNPDDDDFADQVSAVVESAIEKHPKLKVATKSPAAPVRSGGDLSGGNNDPKKGGEPESIEAIRARRSEARKKKYGLL
jgi:hypothetical protein